MSLDEVVWNSTDFIIVQCTFCSNCMNLVKTENVSNWKFFVSVFKKWLVMKILWKRDAIGKSNDLSCVFFQRDWDWFMMNEKCSWLACAKIFSMWTFAFFQDSWLQFFSGSLYKRQLFEISCLRSTWATWSRTVPTPIAEAWTIIRKRFLVIRCVSSHGCVEIF